MDGKLIDRVECCFCGESLLYEHAVLLTVQPNYKSEEMQQLFCHKDHLIEKLNKSIVLHPDIFENEEES